MSREGKVHESSNRIEEYYEKFVSDEDKGFLFAREKKEVIER